MKALSKSPLTRVIIDKTRFAENDHSENEENEYIVQFHLAAVRIHSQAQPHIDPIEVFVKVGNHRPTTLCKLVKPFCIRQSLFQLNVKCSILHSGHEMGDDSRAYVILARRRRLLGRAAIWPDAGNLERTGNGIRALTSFTVDLFNAVGNELIGLVKVKHWKSTVTIAFPYSPLVDGSTECCDGDQEHRDIRVQAASSDEARRSGEVSCDGELLPTKADLCRRVQEALCRIYLRRRDLLDWPPCLRIGPYIRHSTVASSAVSICNNMLALYGDHLHATVETFYHVSCIFIDPELLGKGARLHQRNRTVPVIIADSNCFDCERLTPVNGTIVLFGTDALVNACICALISQISVITINADKIRLLYVPIDSSNSPLSQLLDQALPCASRLEHNSMDCTVWAKALQSDESFLDDLVQELKSVVVANSVELRVSQIVLSKGIESKLVPFIVEVKISINCVDCRTTKKRKRNVLRLDAWEMAADKASSRFLRSNGGRKKIKVPSLVCRLYPPDVQSALPMSKPLLHVSFDHNGKQCNLKRVQRLVCSGIRNQPLCVEVDTVPYRDVRFVQISPNWHTRVDKFRFYR